MKKLFLSIFFLLLFSISSFADTAKQIDFLLSGYRTPTTDVVLSGGKVYTYLDGTSTLSALWTDKDKGGSATNPVILDSSGKAEVYGDNIYKFEIYDSDDVLIETITGLEYFTSDNSLSDVTDSFNYDHKADGSHIVYDSVSDLRASTLIPFDGQLVGLTGYYSAGDGGGQKYGLYWDATSTETDNGGTIFKVTSITTGRWKSVLSEAYIKVEWFGAIGDGVTSVGALINNALEFSLTVGKEVHLGGGTYVIETPIIIKNLMHLIGTGRFNSELVAADGLNDAVIKTYDFDNLTGQAKWLVADGVVYGFTLSNFSIDGNKANQTAGNGISIYGKGYVLFDILVHDAYAVGVYSETANSGGQTDVTDMPEQYVSGLRIRDSGSYGLHYRGPHDGLIDQVTIALAGNDGARFETSANFSGLCTIGTIYSYANTGTGIYVNAPIRGGYLFAGLNTEHGVYFGSSSIWSSADKVETIQNDRLDTDTYSGVYIDSDHVQISKIYETIKYDSGPGVTINGTDVQIGNISVEDTANNANTVGVKVAGNRVKISGGDVRGMTGAGSEALRTGQASGISDCDISMSFNSVPVGWNNVNAGQRNIYRITGIPGAGNTILSGVGPSSTEDWTLACYDVDTTTTFLSKNKGTATVSNGTTSIVVTHNLITTPTASDIQITPIETLGSASF